MMNIFQKLLGPTNKLAEFAEEQLKEVKALNLITIDLNEEAKLSNEELAKQTVLLTEIKTLIKKQVQNLVMQVNLKVFLQIRLGKWL